MKLKHPKTIKDSLMKERQLITIKEIAEAFRMSNRTVAKLLEGKPVRSTSMRKFATELQVPVGDIATFVN